MIRLGVLGAAVLSVALSFGGAEAGTREAIVSACKAQIEEEFGAAEFGFDKIRRRDGEQFAYGEFTMPDGSKQQIRCKVRNGRVDALKFQNPGGAAARGNAWTNTRPEGAEYVPFPEEVEAAEAAAAEEAAAAAAAAAADTAEGEQAEGNSEATETAESEEAETEGDAEPQRRGPVFKRAPGT